MKPEIKQKLLHSILDYDEHTGIFTWKERPRESFNSDQGMKMWNKRYPGKKAGCVTAKGYWAIAIGNVKYAAHRLAFLHFHSIIPKYIDHIDHNPLNNSINNLRGVTHKDNCRNQAMSKSNTSGVKGVYWRKDTSRWAAQIMVDGKTIALGSTHDKTKAVKLRKDAEQFYKFHNNHGVTA
jgi:hypothetical protein